MYHQTLGFIRRNDELLMLNREYAPTLGLWNGVGGKFEQGETATECILREIYEETGIALLESQIQDKGMISWVVDTGIVGGMHVFLANLDDHFVYATPRKIKEEILDWKTITWLLAEANFGVGEMIPKYLSLLLEDGCRYHHKCVIQDRKLTGYSYERINSA
ncbi:NUDIX hydrolase [Planococcus shixiaomingii]|uniref:NUDIX hydrolase n=1 Tax=Planococcus shixiaomingii TaxID=3058393 RepID=UPI00262FF498|nr:NUDIX domain-containing protein [Planococcus sp. N022]WKA56639.1 NUDIX domain-containing protein [Planococcus sp. N022]